MILVKY